MEKEEHYLRIYMGTTYDFNDVRSVRDLRRALEYIINDLPHDDSLELILNVGRSKLEYILKDGIPE
ncbi:TPA: hypothetical protein HA278_06310 [Candidatus Woesearchaeota archaeon]|nr:hypothetical protein [archaeon]HIJ11644.1 hypothetical protein [Candidatus Woesearchaeota archaeon]|tara:strand:+ start:1411 stop:1608 length:198 start_codon:yes stop_codon:yes gene_type:complete